MLYLLDLFTSIMKSQQNWEIGQKLMVKVWIKAGILLMFITIIFAFIVEKNSYDEVLHGYFMIFQTFYLLLTIPIIELLLKKELKNDKRDFFIRRV